MTIVRSFKRVKSQSSICFRSTFFGFHRNVRARQIVLGKGDSLFLPSGWIQFVYTPEEAIAYGCNFIIENHLDESTLTFQKETNEGFSQQFSFPHFGPLLVTHLYREWSYRHRSNPSRKIALRKMMEVMKQDNRSVGTFPFESPWEEFLYHYSFHVAELCWDEIENWLRQ